MRTRRALPLLASAVALLACPGAASASLPGGIARCSEPPVAELAIDERDDDNGPGRHETILGVLVATIDANSQDTTYRVEYGPKKNYGSATAALPAGADDEPAGFDVDLPLEPGKYHARAVATNGSGTDASHDLKFWVTASGEISNSDPGDDEGEQNGTPTLTPAPTPTATPAATPPAAIPDAGAPAAAPPALGKGVVIRPLSGSVRFKTRGATSFRDLGAGVHVPVGSTVDTRHGRVSLQSARNGKGRTQTGTFWGGVFQVRQTRHNRGITDLHLRGGRFAGCGSGAVAGTSALAREAKGKRRVVRRLWGKDKHARFRTHGRDSVATVRGTRWVTTDRCDGTLTKVTEGKVLVRDLRRTHSVLLTAGHAYLARHKRH